MLHELKKEALHRTPDEMPQKEWRTIIERMIFCFSETAKLKHKKDKEKCVYREELKREGFELFVKYFDNLGGIL
jgi:soluble cytochrome b562